MHSPNNKYNEHNNLWQSHPQTNLSTRRSTHNPIPAGVEYCHRGDSRDAVSAELGELVSRGTVNVDKTVHVTDTETLDLRCRRGVLLPLWPETLNNSQ